MRGGTARQAWDFDGALAEVAVGARGLSEGGFGGFGTGDTAWMSDPIVSCVGWTFLLGSAVILRVATCMEEGDTPEKFLEQLKIDQGISTDACGDASRAPVVCLGDSITRGNLSADWVGSLREQLMGCPKTQPTAVLNAGVNMQCIENVKQRISEVIACKPSHVTVLVGTNDLKAELSPVEGLMYRVFGKLPEVPSLEKYESSLREVSEQLRAANIQVALVSPPVLGEDIRCRANQRAAEFAEAVKRVAAEGQCAYLPLFEQTAAQLPKEGGKAYCGLNFFMWCCMLAFDIHVFRRDLSEVQRERQLGVTVDLVHLGPQAASDLAGMVADFVQNPVAREVADFVQNPVGNQDMELSLAR